MKLIAIEVMWFFVFGTYEAYEALGVQNLKTLGVFCTVIFFSKAWPHIGAVDKSAFWNKNRQKNMKLWGVRVAPLPSYEAKASWF